MLGVEPRSRADRAGLRIGDVILRVQGSAVSTPPEVEEVIASEARKGRRTADQLPIDLRLKAASGESRVTIPPEPAARSFAPPPI